MPWAGARRARTPAASAVGAWKEVDGGKEAQRERSPRPMTCKSAERILLNNNKFAGGA